MILKKCLIILYMLIFSGCEEEYTKNGIKYNSQTLYNSIINNINENNILYIKEQICEGKLNIIPLQQWQLKEVNLLITEMHIKIHQINPNFNSKYLDQNYDSSVNKTLEDGVGAGLSLKGLAILALAAGTYESYTNKQILEDPKIKEVIIPYEEKISNLIASFKNSNIGPCNLKIVDFNLGNWDEHWGLTKIAGGYEGKFRDSSFGMTINSTYELNVKYSDYDNKKFSFEILVR